MGLRDWRAKRSMKDPVRGEFAVASEYFKHPASSSFREVLTGVVTAPGVPPTPGEHLTDAAGRWVGRDRLPVLVDRADPTHFVVLWDEVPVYDDRAAARAAAARAAEQAAPGPAPDGSAGTGPSWTASSTSDWAQQVVAGLAARGVEVPGAEGLAGTTPVVVDLTAGHLSAAQAAQLLQTGQRGTAVLLAVTDVGVPQVALPGPTASLCDLDLRVTGPDGRQWDASTRLGFRSAERRAAIAVLGSVLPVRIDPSDPGRVAVDSVAFDADHPDLL